MGKSEAKILEQFNDSTIFDWKQTDEVGENHKFESEFIHTDDVNLRVQFEYQNAEEDPEYLPDQQSPVCEYRLVVYYNQTPVK